MTLIYKKRTGELMDYLVKRGYDFSFLKKQIQRASDIPRNDALKLNQTWTTDGYCSLCHYIILPCLTSPVSFINILMYSTRLIVVEMWSVTLIPLVAYRRCNNISDIIVRAQLPEPIPGSLLVLFAAIMRNVPLVLILKMAAINIPIYFLFHWWNLRN